jgi:hypothetical protein
MIPGRFEGTAFGLGRACTEERFTVIPAEPVPAGRRAVSNGFFVTIVIIRT